MVGNSLSAMYYNNIDPIMFGNVSPDSVHDNSETLLII
jgi:hypothetical protein